LKFKRLIVGSIFKSGRNFSGKKISGNKGFLKKRNISIIDFNRKWSNKIAICLNIVKDSNRSCYTSLIKYSNGSYSYILSSHEMKPGYFLFSSIKPLKFINLKKICCSVILKYLNYSSIFFNVELYENTGCKYSKSAGTFCTLLNLNFEKNTAKITLPTGEIKTISIYCFVTLGRASNINHKLEFFTKAGYFRNKGFRPKVRGVAMNPIDHPHGGRTKTSSPEFTPWGKIAKKNK
jgi:large subunit ribosomal protein L2